MKSILLRAKLMEHEITGKKLAAMLGICPTTVSARMSNPGGWPLGQVYEICTILEIPLEEIPRYFPKEGR